MTGDEEGDANADASVDGETDAGSDDGAGSAALSNGDRSDDVPDGAPSLDRETFREAVEGIGRPVVTARQLARELGWSQSEAAAALDALAEAGHVDRADVGGDPVVFYPAELGAFADPERVILFPDRREVVVEHPEQFTRARLNQFAHLVDTNREGAYIYEIREEDVWLAPFDSIEDLLATMHDTLGERSPALEEFVERQWARARKFALVTRDDYTVLEAASADLMGNVARQRLDDLDEELLHGLISDTEAWVHEGKEGQLKRALYDAGYPVQDQRDLETGDPLDIELRLRLRDYQRGWVDDFEERGAGVFVGPPGSGKTVAAIGAMERVGGETLILVPSRELAAQWREELLTNTSLSPGQIGEYHGGEKDLSPVTIATYQTAGMDRHRVLFEDRRWGLIVFDECLSGETVVETTDGRTTFAQLDEERGFDDGWTRNVDLTVRTFDPEDDEYEWTDVTGVYRTEAPVQRIETDTGHVIEATPGHTHVVFDPESGELTERVGVEVGDYLVRPVGDGAVGRSCGEMRADGGTADAGRAAEGGTGTGRASGGTAAGDRLEGLTVTEVTAVETTGTETVYDFETGSHTFLADGFLTHNCHHVPAPVFRRSTDLQSKHRLGLSATPVRETEDEREIFTLIGPPIGTDWSKLFEAGYVAEPEVEIRFVEWPDETARNEYAAASGHERRQVAATNPAKVDAVRELLDEHGGKALVFVEYLAHGRELADALDAPFVSGETPHAERERLFREFRGGERDVLVVSRVGDEGIDLPNAELAIVASGLGGSRRQGAQRAGRTMRPAGDARMYVLATRGTTEEDFARRQVRHLASKGVRVTERDAGAVGGEPSAGGPDAAAADGDECDDGTDEGSEDSPGGR